MSGFEEDLIQTLHKDADLAEDRIEAALERQVVSGLALSTVILEMGLVDEFQLAMALEKATGLPPLTGNTLKQADPEAISAFPKRLAEKHRMVPVSLEGRRMVVAVSQPPDLNLVEEIEFMLSVYVTPHIVNDVRLSEALFRFYDVELGPTPRGILAMWGEDPDEERRAAAQAQTPFEMPTTQERVEQAAEAERAVEADRDLPSDDEDEEAPAVSDPGGNGQTPGAAMWSVQGAADVTVDEASDATAEVAPAIPAGAMLSGEDKSPAAVKEKLLRDVDDDERAAADAATRRHRERVLWTVDDAIAELALADDRDGLVDVVLRFAHRRLDTAAMFVVERRGGAPHFAGWDIIDQRLTRQDVTGMAVPAQGDNAFAKVYEMRSPFLGPLSDDDAVVQALQRHPRAVLLMPVFVGDKLAAVLYGDNAERSVPPTSLAELHMVVPRFGKALRNLILRKKGVATGQNAPDDEAPDVAPAAKVMAAIPVIIGDEEPSSPIPAAPRVTHGMRTPGPPPPSADRGVYIKTRRPRAGRSYEKPPPLPKKRKAAKPSAPPSSAPSAPAAAAGEGALSEDVPADVIPITVAVPDDAPSAELIGEHRPEASPPDAGNGADAGPAPVDEPVEELAPDDADDLAPPGDINPDDIDTVPVAQRPADPDEGAADADDDDDGADDDDDEDAALHEDDDEERAGPSTMELAADLYDQARADDDDFSLDVAVDAPATEHPTVVPSPGADAKASLLMATYRSWVGTLDDETDSMVIDLQAEGEAGRAAIGRFVRLGDRAMPTLARYFPGALRRDPFGQMDARPEASDFSDALACLSRLGRDRAAPILLAGCDNEDRRHRYAAVWGLASMLVPAAVPKLVERIFDPELRIALLALDVLSHYRDAPLYDKALGQLRQLCRGGETEFHRRRAIMGVAELKDTAALDVLVEFVGTKPREVADEAHRALVHLSKQDFGSSSRRWRAWIADHKNSQRTEWLIQGLLHKDERIRESAQNELNRATGNYFGYRFDAPRAERDAAVATWKSWWADLEDRSSWP